MSKTKVIKTNKMSHTFIVHDHDVVEYLKKYRPETKHFLQHRDLQYKMGKGEILYASPVDTIGGTSPLFDAASRAFNNHCPLVITPDNIWLTILTGLCHHIDSDPEGLRHHFVQHEGKKEIEVVVQHSSHQWLDGINFFAEELQEHIGKKHDLIVSNFSTTTDTDRISSMVALMSSMKHYFEYKMMLACGLGKVTVAGTPEDWDNMIQRVNAMSEFNLEWWTKHLVPTLEQFKRACSGNPETEFWKAIYLEKKYGSGSQSDVTGWVNTFYPYIAGKKPNEMRRNSYVDWEGTKGKGVDKADFPFGMAYAPVEINDNGYKYKSKFYGGLVGVSMAEDFTVQPVSGIAIQKVEE